MTDVEDLIRFVNGDATGAWAEVNAARIRAYFRQNDWPVPVKAEAGLTAEERQQVAEAFAIMPYGASADQIAALCSVPAFRLLRLGVIQPATPVTYSAQPTYILNPNWTP